MALTRTVARAGCASKIGQGDLKRILTTLPDVSHPNILVGMSEGDDAGVWRLDDRTALVQTVDVFTPCVDDPYLFGQIAAANSVSDVYAMGGRPLTALSIVCFPIDEMDGSIMGEMLRGGIDMLNQAGCQLIGGHSVNDSEIKLGFAVTGVIAPDKIIKRARAEPGDLLVLTKPLGIGMVTFAAQIGRVSAAALHQAGQTMAILNKDAAELMDSHGAHACTDVTGFGLAGHLVELARGSGVSVELDLRTLPVLAAALHCLEHEILPGTIERNQEYAMGWVQNLDAPHERNLAILYDAQTSGGLLVALPPDHAETYVHSLRERGHKGVAIIGRVVEKKPSNESLITITNAGLEYFIGTKEENRMKKQSSVQTCCSNSHTDAKQTSCCDALPEDSGISEQGGEALTLFKEFMKAANQPGLIDAKNKKLMAIVLSIAMRCEPCLKIHLKAAVAMKISRAEIDEAASLAVAFGGCSAMMFYKEVREGLPVLEARG